MPSRVFRTVKLAGLVDHPLNSELYDTQTNDDLVESIGHSGVISPIVLAADGKTIVSGHRRRRALLRSGVAEEEVIVDLELDDDTDISMALIQSNKQRVKTPLEIGRELRKLLELVEARRGSRAGAYEEVAAETGMAPRTVRRRVKLATAVAEAEAKGDTATAEKLAARATVPAPKKKKQTMTQKWKRSQIVTQPITPVPAPPAETPPDEPERPVAATPTQGSYESFAELHDRAIADINGILRTFQQVMSSPVGKYIGCAHTRLERHLNDAKIILQQLKPVGFNAAANEFITRAEQESRRKA